MLEHSIVLVYSSEDDWVEHREPLDDIALSADSAVELSQERDEVGPVFGGRGGAGEEGRTR